MTHSFKYIYDDLFERCEKLRTLGRKQWCCIAIDIEQFRIFNEIYGRDKGDKLLEQFATIINSLQEDSVSAYLGNDNFVLFMEFNYRRIEVLEKELCKAVTSLTDSLGFRPALGVYCLDSKEPMDLEVYDKAVIAMKKAKANRKNRIQIYGIQMEGNEKSDTKVLLDLQKAVENGEITFYLQPQCRISTREVVGAEALARWIKDDGTMVSPGKFIPILEKKGFIADFDKIVWKQVCQWISSLLDRGLKPVPISINVSQIDIITMDVAKYLTDLCDQYRIPHKLLKVEITESSFAEEYELMDELVQKLKKEGFSTLMDDFGSGYSSLNMLERIPVDVLKLDMTFLNRESTKSRRSITIIESIINMAKMMSLPMVVEGVEFQDQVDFLNSTGCRYAQGFYYYRPMSKTLFEDILKSGQVDYRGFTSKLNEQLHVREFMDENTFTDTMLNNVLGAVAFYTLEDKDLCITRFNEQFYKMIADPGMESRQTGIQNYVVKEDWPNLYRALEEAKTRITEGSICEIRFYKSDGGVFWFKMHFFYLKQEAGRSVYYGKIEDVTESREQSLQFLETLREQSVTSMMMNLDRNIIQYVTEGNTLSQPGLPSMDLTMSNQLTAKNRFETDEERKKFLDFFNPERLRSSHSHAIYHEKIILNFKMCEKPELMEFTTNYIRWSKEQDLVVYVFVKRAE